MKRGSALLIVLGMLAFMVISAVAFSAFMRYSRLPSSYLRRTSSSRQLAKAALAEAIDILDVSIGNDPFPGLGDNGGSYRYPRKPKSGQSGGGSPRQRNYWRGHVFTGTNRLVNASETVSTLTLEGLAYLPPGLINEARYFSRHSTAAMWHDLGFDSGRFAFCAVDVSDHIDVNRVFADRPRNSSDRGRLTLAHVFEETPDHTFYATPSPSQWDDFVAKYNEIVDLNPGDPLPKTPSKLPFTSLADLNLAINREGWSSTLSPFCRYFGGTEYVTDPDSDARLGLMSFVTDSYFPDTNTTESAKYDLCRAQPFGRMWHEKNRQMSYDDQLDASMSTPSTKEMRKLLYDVMTEIDSISLYDYLDENDIPTSLAIPSVERVPMICALRPTMSLQFKTEKTEEPEKPGIAEDAETKEAPGTIALVKYNYKLKLVDAVGDVDALCMYPFRRDDAADTTKFTLDFAFRLGFVAGTTGPGLRAHKKSPLAVATAQDFEAKKNGAVVNNGVVKFHMAVPGSVKSSGVKEEKDAFSSFGVTLKFDDLRTWCDNNIIFSVPHKYVVEADNTTDPPKRRWKHKGVFTDKRSDCKVNVDLHPLGSNGMGDGGFTPDALLAGNSVEVTPCLTLTARIMSDRSSKTVDLVPAWYEDDAGYNGLNTPAEVGDVCGSERPILSMVCNQAITFGEATFGKDDTLSPEFAPNGKDGVLICPDPRWNFAPENFFVKGGSSLPEGQAFLDLLDLENGGRDCDIFLMVSNQGYMQSPSEIAFLPRTTTARLPNSDQFGTAATTFNKKIYESGEGAVAPYGNLPHGDLMWKTYRLFAHDGNDDNIYGLGITYGGSGYRANPFAASKDAIMAAFANTPVSWWAASTNYTDNAEGKSQFADMGAEEFNKNYAFSGMNNKAKFAWKDLELVAENLRNAMRRADGNWQAGFHIQDWDGESSDLCGVSFQNGTQADDFYDIDRKMLYGFWRDSLSPRQQLFLVFVRAEPMMMGGGAIGQTPPQLGARAVALVWRDPTDPRRYPGSKADEDTPHRTRILFYRQFD